MVRQILGAVSEFEKAQIVSKLKAARTRKREETGKCEGRKSYKEMDPALASEAKQLRGDGYTLAKFSDLLFEQGYKTSSGKGVAPANISRLIAQLLHKHFQTHFLTKINEGNAKITYRYPHWNLQ